MKNNNLDFFLEKIKNDKYLNSFIKELTDEQIENNIMILYKQAKDNCLCNSCLGKKPCEKDEEKYQSYLMLDGDKVVRKLTPCEYIPTYNFELVDLLYMPEDMFMGQIDYENSARAPFFKQCVDIKKGNSIKGTYLYGKYGTGKSFLTFNFVNTLAKSGKTVCYCLVPELIRTIKNNLTVPNFMDKLIVKLKKVDVLVLDDLGGELNTAFSRDEILFPILDSRMNDKSKLTFGTSNLTFEALEKHYADEKEKFDPVSAGRIMERIRSIMIPIELEGMNYRH